MPPLLSVVIPTYNRRDLVQQAVQSALACSAADVEVIVVDDGSSDDTAAALARFGSAISLISQMNAGRSAARNAGARRAHGRYLAFLDSDDVWEPWHVAQLRAAAVSTGEDRLLAAPTNYWEPRSGALHRVTTKTAFRPRDLVEATLVGTTLTLQGLFVPREVFHSVGGFDEDLRGSEDWAFGIRLARRVQVAHALDRASVRIRLHDGRSMSDVDWDIRWRKRACHTVVMTARPPLTSRECALARAGTARYCAARLYESGRMTEARAELAAVRRQVGLFEATLATGRLRLQTHVPALMPYARGLRSRLRGSG